MNLSKLKLVQRLSLSFAVLVVLLVLRWPLLVVLALSIVRLC